MAIAAFDSGCRMITIQSNKDNYLPATRTMNKKQRDGQEQERASRKRSNNAGRMILVRNKTNQKQDETIEIEIKTTYNLQG